MFLEISPVSRIFLSSDVLSNNKTNELSLRSFTSGGFWSNG